MPPPAGQFPSLCPYPNCLEDSATTRAYYNYAAQYFGDAEKHFCKACTRFRRDVNFGYWRGLERGSARLAKGEKALKLALDWLDMGEERYNDNLRNRDSDFARDLALKYCTAAEAAMDMAEQSQIAAEHSRVWMKDLYSRMKPLRTIGRFTEPKKVCDH